MRARIYIYIYTYIHTYIHTYIPFKGVQRARIPSFPTRNQPVTAILRVRLCGLCERQWPRGQRIVSCRGLLPKGVPSEARTRNALRRGWVLMLGHGGGRGRPC